MKESKRQKKFGRLIQKELSDIFQRDLKSFAGDFLLTVTAVQMTPDLSLARVYVSFFTTHDKGELIAQLNDRKSEVRRLLGGRIHKQVRHIPDLFFSLDDTAEEAAKIDALLASLNIPPADVE